MKEPEENFILICKSCGDERKNNWQKNNKHTTVKIGDFVKITACSLNNQKEHMWFKVIKFDNGKIIGKCNNDPQIVNIKCGDLINFKFEDIEDHIPKRGKIENQKKVMEQKNENKKH